MLQLILGISGTGKTSRVLEEMKTRAAAGRRSVLLVPEQFTSSAETMVYTVLGDALSSFTGVYSFTSYAELILKNYGGIAVQTLTDAGCVVMVRRAMDSLGDEIETYRRHRRNTGFCTMCADAIKELKTAGASGETLVAVAQTMGESGTKLYELGLIFAAYDGLLRGVALDPADRVATAAARMQAEFVAEDAVFIDNFDGFTAPQYDLLAKLVLAESCTVTLCCDSLSDHEDGLGLFSPVKHTAQRLRRLATAENIAVAAPIVLTEDLRHREAPALAAVNQILASGGARTVPSAGVFLTQTDNVYNECKTAACRIASLAATGVRYNDTAIICRTMDAYDAPLRYELNLAGVPFFADESTTLEHTAPAAFLRAALALLARGITSENVLRLLKTDLCGFSEEDVAALENYAYTWQLKSADWHSEFLHNPAGFTAEMRPEDVAALAAAERVRAEIVPKIDRFLSAAKGADAQTLSKQLYFFLQAFEADAHTAQLAGQLDEIHAAAVYRTWNTMMELLGQMTSLLGDDDVTAAEYDELLVLLLRAADIGHVPQTQNAVIVTTADRMRLASPRYCFVLGVAEGEFPKIVGYSGLLTHTDREKLVDSGVEMPGSFENRTLLEQMFFYRALTAPSEGLYLSAPTGGGAALSASLAGIVAALDPPQVVLSTAEKSPTPAAALDLLGAQYRDDTPETAALAAALAGTAALSAMEQAVTPQPFAAKDTAALEKILGTSMSISPTRIEQYYRCRFSYFLEYVLRIKPRKKAELSPLESGSLVHYILENALKEAGENFINLTQDEIFALATRLADAYVAENMPDAGTRFQYLITRLKKGVAQLLLYLQEEQRQSSFHPAAFEQEIGYSPDAVPPLTLHTPEGKTVQIVGKIDRVDVMRREGRSYLRVVDYKTGDKTFSLDEVYCGLNTQMLFYLFTLTHNAQAQFPNPVAAGVLYLAGDPAPKGTSRIDAQQPMTYKIDGLVLNDEVVVHSMDKEATGLFVPFTFAKDGKPRASAKLASLEKLGNIEKHLETLVVDMAKNLYAGDIVAAPLNAGQHCPCDVCQYWPVCCHEQGQSDACVKAPKNVFEPSGEEAQTDG